MNVLSVVPWDDLSKLVDRILESRPSQAVVKSVGSFLQLLGVPSTHHPDAEQIAISLGAIIATLTGYWYWLGKSHLRRRLQLAKELEQAHKTVHDLEDKLLSLEAQDLENKSGEKEIRIWMDGAFDMMHYGHMNAFRQGRALGTYLVVGVNSDESITKCKGAPVMNDEERVETVKGCKWVDEVVTDVPYIMNDEYLKYVIEKYRIDYVVHGDDPCIVDGKDVYESAQKMGKYLTIPRTEGISTTDIVGRMLLMTRQHHFSTTVSNQPVGSNSDLKSLSLEENKSIHFDRKTKFLTTSRVLRLFSAGIKAPKSTDRIVYLAGSWDMFHSGHMCILEQARQFGDYVIVGVHNDGVVNSHRGMNLPIMNLHERVLSVLGCKYVNDVLIDAPYEISLDMIQSLNISIVVKGTVVPQGEYDDSTPVSAEVVDPYQVAKELDILRIVKSKTSLTALDIVERIHKQRERFQVKFNKKKTQEDEYYHNKYSHSLGSNLNHHEHEHVAKVEKVVEENKTSHVPPQ